MLYTYFDSSHDQTLHTEQWDWQRSGLANVLAHVIDIVLAYECLVVSRTDVAAVG